MIFDTDTVHVELVMAEGVCEYPSLDHYSFFARNESEIVETINNLYSLGHRINGGGMFTPLDAPHTAPKITATINSIARQLREAVEYSDVYGLHWQDAWQYRERHRFRSGIYRALPNTISIAQSFPREHYAHLPNDPDDHENIAFTATPEKGRADCQTVMSFGRYLKKYLPTISDAKIQEYVRLFRAAQETENFDLAYATDKATITRIFETKMCAQDSTTLSCMYGKFTGSKFADNKPYHVYADSSDVAVSYLTDSTGQIIARSVVSTRQKHWIRLYAIRVGAARHEVYIQRLKSALEAEGYKHGSLFGDRLTKRYDTYGENIGPYLDSNAAGIISHDRNFWVVTDNDDAEYVMQNQDGYITEIYHYICNICNDRYNNADDVTPIGDYCYCNACRDAHFVQAKGLYGKVWTDIEATILDCDDNYYTQRYADRHLVFRDDTYHTADCAHLCIECDNCSFESTDEDDFVDGLCADCQSADCAGFATTDNLGCDFVGRADELTDGLCKACHERKVYQSENQKVLAIGNANV